MRSATAEVVSSTKLGQPGSLIVDSIDRTGLNIDDEKMAKILEVDREAWRGEVALVERHFEFIGERLPQEMRDELANLEKRLVG